MREYVCYVRFLDHLYIHENFLSLQFAPLMNKKCFAAVALTSVSGTLGGLVPGNLVWISLMRLLTGAGEWTILVVATVWAAEVIPSHGTSRAMVVVGLRLAHLLGQVLLAAEAYHVRSWVNLQLLVHAPIILALGGWTITRDPRPKSDKPPTEVGTLMQLGAKAKAMTQPVPILAKLAVSGTLALALSLAHYGTLTRSTAHLTDHTYWQVALSPIMEMGGVVGALVALCYLTRRNALLLGLTATGVCCLLLGLLPGMPDLFAIVSVVGTFSSSATLSIYMLYMIEIHQTGKLYHQLLHGCIIF